MNEELRRVTAYLQLGALPTSSDARECCEQPLRLVSAHGEDFGYQWQPCWIAPLWHKASASTMSSSPIVDMNCWRAPESFSGRGSSFVMRLFNFVRFFVQVSRDTCLYARKSDNTCLLLFPRPGIVLSLLSECAVVVKELLLLCGDVEENPGPNTRSQDAGAKDDAQPRQLSDIFSLLQDMNTRTAKMERDQVDLITTVNEIKKSQQAIQAHLTDIDKRLSVVEGKTAVSDSLQQEWQQLRSIAENLARENFNLRTSQAELEDRQRRDNILFHGLPDGRSESWAETEEKLVNLLSSAVRLPASELCIERAHRLGSF